MKKFAHGPKRHFQLLEVMIAMLLIVICVAPALHIYTNLYKQETQTAQRYEADHLARLLYVTIIESLYHNEISLDEIQSGIETSLDHSKYGAELKKIGYRGWYCLAKVKEKKVKSAKVQELRYLVAITIYLENIRSKIVKQYDYFQMVATLPPIKSQVSGQQSSVVIDDDEDLTQYT